MIQPLWKTVWRFLKKLGIKPPYDPAISLLGIYPKETRIERDTCADKARDFIGKGHLGGEHQKIYKQ